MIFCQTRHAIFVILGKPQPAFEYRTSQGATSAVTTCYVKPLSQRQKKDYGVEIGFAKASSNRRSHIVCTKGYYQ